MTTTKTVTTNEAAGAYFHDPRRDRLNRAVQGHFARASVAGGSVVRFPENLPWPDETPAAEHVSRVARIADEHGDVKARLGEARVALDEWRRTGGRDAIARR